MGGPGAIGGGLVPGGLGGAGGYNPGAAAAAAKAAKYGGSAWGHWHCRNLQQGVET